jgi:hypothetical protein
VFVDQFEELFSVVAERYREPFVAMLVAATQAPRLRIVATVRADFYHLCLDWPRLAEVLRTASFPLAAPGPAALYEMVTGPAARAGLVFEEGLPSRILDDTGTAPGSLALVAFALHELYDARAPDGKLTHRAYEGFGKVQGAVSKRAEDTFTRLPAAAQSLLGSIFRELVEVDERGVATRRRLARTRLASSAQAEALVDAFTDARLLVSDQSPEGAAVVEVAHEALLREWPRLKAWVADIADDLRLWRQVEAAAAEWHRSGRDATYLWPHERLVPAHQALDQLRIDRTMLVEPVKSFIRPEDERLLEELERPETSHYRRAEIGDRLDRIGDPRPGVRLRPDGLPDIVWCEVPGGTANLENVDGSFEVKPFSIAKYPVTYLQYKAFLDDADGYRSEHWWEGLKHEAWPGEQYRPTGNCPADNVSWYDAVAYCRWLGARLGREVRLPTEWEWQQAATGGDAANEYPWGPAWIDGCANIGESRLSRTTAVGMYPGGASSQGVLDLAGNVWEWCLNTHKEPRASPSSGEAPRVVRGGSWSSRRVSCRCAYRYGAVPDSRYYNVGFRLCCAPPIR